MAHAPITVSTLKVVIIVNVFLDISFNPTNVTVKVSIVDYTVPFHEHLWVYGYVRSYTYSTGTFTIHNIYSEHE